MKVQNSTKSENKLVTLLDKIQKDTGLNQRQVAELVGYDEKYISNLINGNKKVSEKTLQKVELVFKNYKPSAEINLADRARIIALNEFVAKLMAGKEKFPQSLQECLNAIDERTMLELNKLLRQQSLI